MTDAAEPPVRTFVALPLPAAARDAVSELGRQVAQRQREARPVRPDTAHLTLAFLGDLGAEARAEVVAAARRAAAEAEPFLLVLAGLGGFPRLERARVAYLACDAGGPQASHLHDALIRALPPELAPEDRRAFTPHVTVARTRGRARLRLDRLPPAVQAWRLEAGPMAHLHVMRSELTEAGPRHEVAAAVPLGPQPPLRGLRGAP